MAARLKPPARRRKRNRTDPFFSAEKIEQIFYPPVYYSDWVWSWRMGGGKSLTFMFLVRLFFLPNRVKLVLFLRVSRRQKHGLAGEIGRQAK
jgi:hypothetical protein